jgi:Uma2 family endonuclease
MSAATYKLSIEEYDRMIASGVLAGDARVELIEGEIREMAPPGPAHEHLIDRLTRWSVLTGAKHSIWVRIQNSIGLPETTSAPQPDVAWVREREYWDRRPQSLDVLLVIEVADSSLRYDRQVKGSVYAAAGVPEYWIVNVDAKCIEVYRDPKDDGFGSKRTYAIGDHVSPLCASDEVLEVAWLFGVLSA